MRLSLGGGGAAPGVLEAFPYSEETLDNSALTTKGKAKQCSYPGAWLTVRRGPMAKTFVALSAAQPNALAWADSELIDDGRFSFDRSLIGRFRIEASVAAEETRMRVFIAIP